MEKIIAAIDGLKYSENTVEYAIYVAKKTKALLVGVFLDDFTYSSIKLTDLMKTKEGLNKKLKQVEKKDRALRAVSVGRFESSCKEAKINFMIHHDKNLALQDLLNETIYADLLIIDKKETLSAYEYKLPTRFIRDLLPVVKCPVLIISEHLKTIDNVLFLYDGKPASMHALKMFSYVLPLKENFNVEILYVREHDHYHETPNSDLVEEYLKLHFPQTKFSIKFGHPETEIEKALDQMDPGTIVILGAYDRSSISRWLKQSMADRLMKDSSVPLFIAHNK